MSDPATKSQMTRRELFETVGKVAVVSVVATPFVGVLGDGLTLEAAAEPLTALAGVDRIVMHGGKTYLNGWAGCGARPRPGRRGGGGPNKIAPPAGRACPAPTRIGRKVRAPANVTSADAHAAATPATFSETGDSVLKVTADNGSAKATSTLAV